MQTCDVEIVQSEVDVSQQAVVLIDNTIDASIETVSPIVQVNAEEYVLSSGGMYGGSAMVGAVPQWILDAVQQQLTTGDGNLMSILTDLQALMTSFQIGVNQQISSLNTDMYSQNGIITTISSQVEKNRADAINLISTKATPEYALAVATDAINARFSDEFGGVSAEAFVGNIASTYVDANSAIASEVGLIQSTLNGVSASITSFDEIIIEQGEIISQLELDTGINLSDLQGQLDHSISMWLGNVPPTTSNAPANTWIAILDKKAHNGDLYYDKVNGIGYEYVYNALAQTEEWVVITDQLKIDALYQESLREDTLDGKRSVYYTADEPNPMASDGVTPIPIETGDLWINSISGVTKVRSAGGLWVDITNTATQNALIDLGVLQETNDGVVNTYYQRLAPTTGMSYGDWWVNVVEEHTGTAVPSLANLPASAWTTTTAKDSHLGDIYTKTDTLSKYKFKVAAGVYSWELITDVNSIVYATAWRYEDPDGLNKPGMTWVYKDPAQNILANNAVNSELAKRKIAAVINGTTQIDLSQHINGAGWTTDASLTNWIETVFEPFAAQLDNVIETHFGDAIPTLSNAPANTWTDTATKDLHLGDIYYDTLSGIGYRFVVSGGVYSWSVISDSGVAAALEAASNAQDTADGKRRTFISGWDSVNLTWLPVLPVPPYDRGDLFTPLVDTVNGAVTYYKNEVYVCNIAKATGLTFSNGDFVAGTNAKVVEDAIADLNSDIGLLKGLVDNKVETFLQPSPPHPSPITLPINHESVPEYDSYINDLWFSNDINGKTYVYKRTATGNTIVNYGYVTEAYNFPTINNGLIIDPITSHRDLSQGGILQMPTGTNDYVYAWEETPVPKEVFDAIDGKKIIFTTMPSKYFVRDMMIPAVTFTSGGVTFQANEIYIASTDATAFDAGHWSKATKYTDDTVANTAIDNATAAQESADTANILLADIASDNKLTASEKQKVKLEWDLIVSEVPKVLANATSAGILVTDPLYTTYYLATSPYGKYQLLSAYITPLLADLSTTSTIVGTTFRDTFKAYYDAKIELLLAISIKLKDKADAAQAKADGIANGTVAINLASATIGGVNIASYVAGEIDKEVVILSGTATPTVSPTTPVGKLNDIYIQKTTASGASGILVDVVNTWKHNGTIWEAIGNNNNLTALADLTDGKRTIYSNDGANPPSSGVNLNDLWIPSSTNGDYIKDEIYIYKTTGWEKATKYTDDTKANSIINGLMQIDLSDHMNTLGWTDDSSLDAFLATTYADDISDIQNQLDGKSVSWFQSTEPFNPATGTADQNGDVWFNSSTKELKVYAFSTKTWSLVTDPKAVSAYDLASTAKTTADGKIQNFTAQPTTPYYAGDTWMQGSTGDIYVANVDRLTGSFTQGDWIKASKYTDDTVANAMSAVYYSATAPTVLTHPYLSEGDQWIPPANTGGYKANSIYTYINGAWVASTTESAEYAKNQIGATMYNSPSTTTPVAVAPAVLAVGDLWVVTDRWYTDATTSASSTTRTTYGYLVRKYNGSTWADITNTEAKASSLKWSAKSSKFITAPDGSITGFEMSDGSAQVSAFTITADQFKLVASGQSVASRNPMSVDATTGEITFNGKVSFNSVTGGLTTAQQASINTTNVTNGAGWTTDAVANSKPNVYYQSTAPSSTGRILGDLWFDSDDKNQPYRWNGTTWQSVRDLSITDVSNAASAANTAALNALTVAQAAQATADNAIRTYYQSAAPTGLNSTTDVGDMWFDIDDGQAYRWNGTTWVIIEDNSIAVALAAAQSAQTTADGKITSYYQAGQPALADTGDLWYDTDDKNKVYYYNGTSWITLRDGTIADAQTAANNAQSTANTASTNATNALNQLTNIASDNILSPVEKPTVISDKAVIDSEQSGIDAQATSYGITTEKTAYDNAVSALTTYLATLTAPVAWNNVSGDTTIVGTTFRAKFQDVYTTRQTLLNKIYANAKTIADAAALTAQWSSVSNRPTSLATLNAADGTSLANATTAISDMASDNILSALEKSSVRSEWNTIVLEKAGIESQATIYGITTEKTNYISTITTLGTYLNAGTAWTFSTTVIPSWINDANLSTNTTIVGATFRTNFNNYYVARQALVNKINDSIKALADTAQSTANSKLSSTADLAALINANTTTIDGGKITTGTITSGHIDTAGLNAGVIKAGVMYNTGGTSTTYTMKIDLDNGLIHIK